MFCSNCGNKIDDGARFCNNCGAPVRQGDVDLNSAAKYKAAEEKFDPDALWLQRAGIMHIISASLMLILIIIYATYGAFSAITLLEAAAMGFTAFVCLSNMSSKGVALAVGFSAFCVIYFISETLPSLSGRNVGSTLLTIFVFFGTFGICILTTLRIVQSRTAALIVEGVAFAIIAVSNLVSYGSLLSASSSIYTLLIIIVIAAALIYYGSLMLISMAFTQQTSGKDTGLNRWLVLAIIAGALFILFAILSSSFFTVANILNIFSGAAVYGIMAVGVTFVIISGGIDLSVGAVAALSGVCAAIIMRDTGLPAGGILLGIGLGAAAGFGNGAIVSRFKIPPFIITLGMAEVCRGVAYLVSDGYPIANIPDEVRILGSGSVIGIPIPIILWACFVFAAFLVLKYTQFGKNIYLAGSNKQAARNAGFNTGICALIAYIVSGLCAAFGGIVLTSRINAGQSAMADGYELEVIAAAVIGGCSLSGGKGGVIGSAVGVIIMALVQNGMTILGASSYTQQVIMGAIIIVAVIVDSLQYKGEPKTI